MKLELEHVARLKDSLEHGNPFSEALEAIEDTEISDGLWRFYSKSWPAGGMSRWNTESRWKEHWKIFLPHGAFAFGEDVFGNQLIAIPGEEDVFLWNHENGECMDLHANVVTLLTTVLAHGIDWVELYENGSLEVARRHGAVPRQSHLHWVTPLILGGAVSSSNIAVVERESHLVGHVKLWSQVQQLPPGTVVAPK